MPYATTKVSTRAVGMLQRYGTAAMLVLLLATQVSVIAQEPAASDQAPLGSPDFSPSAEHPVGWRGDGSGRFPGATPPTAWSRRLVDITSELLIQAAKPNGKPGADSHVLGYFTVKDWLVAGPFPAPDPGKDIDNDFLGGEADVQPDVGTKAGGTQWKAHRAFEGSQSYRNCNEYTSTHLFVDFVYALGTLVPPVQPAKYAEYANLDQQAAYAHTYVYAPRAADLSADFVQNLPAIKVWVNGVPQRLDGDAKDGRRSKGGTIKMHLQEGWNRLLVKAICDKAQLPWGNKASDPQNVLGRTAWRFAVYLKPEGAGPYSYATKNVAWMLKLTGRNCSQPIVVGDRLFVGSGSADLLCIEKASGRIRWLQTGTAWDAMTAEERASVKDKAEPLLQALDKANEDLVALLNAHITPQGLDTGLQAGIDKTLGEREKLARSLHDALSSGRKGKLYLNEVSSGNATPTSDGRRVYWVVQGSGGYLTTAFDLEGKRIWSTLEYQKDTGEHGTHRSPLLREGKLFVTTNESLIAYDAATGKDLWRTPSVPSGSGTGGTPIPVRIDGRLALQTSKCLVGLDGQILASRGFGTWGSYLPIVEDGVLYNPCTRRYEWAFEAVPLSKEAGTGWKLQPDVLYGPLFNSTAIHYIASPLYVDGLLYQIEMSGILTAVDIRKRELAYRQWMDGYNFHDRGLYGYCASPALAGKGIYLLDDAGCATIVKPGAEGTVVGRSMLQNVTNLPASAPGRQEVFYAGMYFDGKRMFLHGDEYLYCIEEK